MSIWGDVWDATGGAILDKAGYGDDEPEPVVLPGDLTAGEADREWGWTAPPQPEEPHWLDKALGAVGGAVTSTLGGEWVPDPWEDAWDATGGRALTALSDAGQDIWAGDVSGAVGDLFGGGYDIAKDVALWGGQELGELAADFGQNAYTNWGLDDALHATGGFFQDLPGRAVDLAGHAGSQLLDLGQAGLEKLGDFEDYLQEQALNAAKWGGQQMLDLGEQSV